MVRRSCVTCPDVTISLAAHGHYPSPQGGQRNRVWAQLADEVEGGFTHCLPSPHAHIAPALDPIEGLLFGNTRSEVSTSSSQKPYARAQQAHLAAGLFDASQ